MHRPPSVEYPTGQSRWFARALVAVWSAALLIDLAWLLQAGPGDWRPWVGLASTLIGLVVAMRVGGIVVEGALVWDGDVWWWEHGGQRVQGVVTPELDLQRLLLLRFVPDQGRRSWFLLERGSDAARWLALRRAVHGPAGRGYAADRPAGGPGSLIEP